MRPLDVVEIFRTPRRIPPRRGDGKWHWRFKDGGNHKIMATGAEGYFNLPDMCASISQVLGLVEFVIHEPQRRVSRQGGWPDVLVVVVQ